MKQLTVESFVEQKSKSKVTVNITPELLKRDGFAQDLSSEQDNSSVVELSTFNATTSIWDQEVKVSFDGNEIEKKSTFIEFINLRLQDIESSKELIQKRLVVDLLELKNTVWIDDRQLSAEEFINKLSFSEIVFYVDQSIVIQFNDEQLFGGHCITLPITADFQLGKCSI
ncbi:MAG: DUF2262 domain-containing protein [Cytophagales bacterium]|nr:DUF2262 domain-containing protein [Cytophagales bacterium]